MLFLMLLIETNERVQEPAARGARITYVSSFTAANLTFVLQPKHISYQARQAQAFYFLGGVLSCR